MTITEEMVGHKLGEFSPLVRNISMPIVHDWRADLKEGRENNSSIRRLRTNRGACGFCGNVWKSFRTVNILGTDRNLGVKSEISRDQSFPMHLTVLVQELAERDRAMCL